MAVWSLPTTFLNRKLDRASGAWTLEVHCGVAGVGAGVWSWFAGRGSPSLPGPLNHSALTAPERSIRRQPTGAADPVAVTLSGNPPGPDAIKPQPRSHRQFRTGKDTTHFQHPRGHHAGPRILPRRVSRLLLCLNNIYFVIH